ncbi:MAG: hypothetical protein RQ745_10685 [Longimicrobiales bacterium]|nr:hypothetical protein [Longimicrobiales bacterium]
MKLAALVGVPFGLTLVALATMYLAIPPTPFLVAVASMGAKAALALGVTLVVLLIAGFVMEGVDDAELDDDFR